MSRVWDRAVLVALLLLVCRVLGAEAPAPRASSEEEDPTSTLDLEAYHQGLDVAGWPILSYRDDWGWLFGAYLDVFDYGEARAPEGVSPALYEWRVRGQSVATPGRMHDHFVQVDLPGIGASALRLLVSAGYGDYPSERYFGLGNASTWDPALESKGDPEFLHERYTCFRLRRPWATLSARLPLGLARRLLLVGALGWEWDMVDAESGTRMALERPRGVEGAAHGYASLGLLYDSRDSEAMPGAGHLASMTLRGGGPALGGEYWFTGVNLELRAYHRLVGSLILANRIALDALAGAPPFWELAAFRGVDPFLGLGGGASLRGYPRRRFIGPLKLLWNMELRWTPLSFALWNQRLDLGAVLFKDSGRVWSWEDDGPLGWTLGMHNTLGAGLRAAWDEHTVFRVDLGCSNEAQSIDLVVGQMF